MRTALSRHAAFGYRFTVQEILSSACAFLALTAVAGGIGLTGGGIQPGDELLRGSPFTSYLIPGLVLLVVGGSALAATALLLIGHLAGAAAAALAGVMMMCFELVEIWVIGSPPGLPRNLQIFYLVLGGAIAVTALLARETLRRRR